MRKTKLAAGIAAALMLEAIAVAGYTDMQTWVVDPLVKQLQTQPAPAIPKVAIEVDAARNEYESAQIVVRATAGKIESLTVKPGEMSGPGSIVPSVQAGFLGYVPVKHGTSDTPDDHLVAKPPVDLPDPILDKVSMSVDKDRNQPVWITIYVPKDTQPGAYVGKIEITGDGATSYIPVKINVRKFTLPDDRTLQITNWFSPNNITKWHRIGALSDRYWRVLENYASIMAEHRQNVIITHNLELIQGRDDGKGKLTFDFTNFDRWVELFIKAGVIGTIEGGHFGGRREWTAPDFDARWPRITLPDGTAKPTPSVKVTSEEYRAFLAQYLPALQVHLEQKGWLNRYVQHLCDEPIKENAASYKKLASYVRQYAPKFKIIEACMCSDLVGAIDIWVPQPEHFGNEIEFFRERQKAGDVVWFYTCLAPKGKYMNRFVDYPLIDVRLLHWVNYKYDLPGYLHWGFNYAQADPWTHLEPDWGGGNHLPPGDSHIVYPGRARPLSSIRLDAMRDGIEDYEMLKILEKTDAKLARETCDSIVRSLTDYTTDPEQFRSARQRILAALDKRTR